MRITLGKTSVAGLGLFLLLVAMYSIGTISAITVSWTTTLLFLAASVIILAFNFVSGRGMHVNRMLFCWLILTLLCFIGVIRGGSTTVLAFYVIGLIMIATCEGIEAESLFSSLKWMKWFGLFFSAGCFWQYFFSSQYYATLYPLFGSVYQQSIRRQFTFHKMCTGFTSQTAVAAEFIILGLMVVIYTFSLKHTKRQKILSIIEIIFLVGGLLLTGKRSPVLNLAAAIIVVDMITVKRNKRGNRIVWIALGVIVALTIFHFVAPLFVDSRNSLVRLLEFTSMEDVGEASNGRLSLYSFAISEFSAHPILGIGWGRYSQIYDITGVHNIYLQLLCECGLIGFVLSIGGMISVLVGSIRMLKTTNTEPYSIQAILMKCSVFIQVYILVYGIFGNPLYDQNYMLMYLIGIMISASMSFRYKNLSII